MKRLLLSLVGAAVFYGGLHRWLLRERAVVVLLHRIDDRYPTDPITRTWADFEKFLRFFSRFFRVVSLEELFDRLANHKSIGRHLVITFDDGYLDNRQAGDLLKQYGLPATFFVATDFMESDHVTWWDKEVGIESEWMDWDQVRELGDDGFGIGAHTRTHVDLGTVTGEAALAEIEGSRHRIHEELKRSVPFFTFPYGRPENITEETRALVKGAGFRCCMSAFGGLVRPGDDPYTLKRQPVSHWHRSPYHFGLDLIRTR